MILRTCYNIAFIFVFALNAYSQGREYNFINYTQENGLPSNECYFIYRDSKEFLWIATDKGVVRYDGNKMETFDLPDNVVFKIREDSKGRIWFFSHTGKLSYFFNGIIYPYKFNENISKSIKDILITDAYVDSNDNIIINSVLLYNYKISNNGLIEKTYYLKSALTDSTKINIASIGKNIFFAQTINFAQNNSKFLFISRTNNNGTQNYKIPFSELEYAQYGCATINNKDIFFFIGSTVIKLAENGSFMIKRFPSKILCLNANNSGQVWVGLMKSGALLLDSNLHEIYSPAALNHKSISSISYDYEGGTWFSTLEKGIYFLKNMSIGYFNTDSSLLQEVFRMYNVNDSALWYANVRGIYSLTDHKTALLYPINNTMINDLFMDDKKNIYVAGKIASNANTNVSVKKTRDASLILLSSSSEVGQPSKKKFVWNFGGYLLSLDLNQHSKTGLLAHSNIVPNRVLAFKPGSVFSDFNNQVWAGTINGLYKLIPTADTINSYEEPSPLFRKGITCMRQMDNGIYAIGIRFAGIALMKDTAIIGNITENDGLLSTSIKYLLPLKDQLWAATAKGISVIQFHSYNPLRYTITNIGKNEGFNNLIIQQLMPYRDNILAATSNGIYMIERPERFLAREPKKIFFYINSINSYKGDTSAVTDISVPYRNNRLKIKYSAISFNSSEEIKYYYRLDKKDTSWQTIDGTELLLENLSPGLYGLELKANIPSQNRFSGIQKLTITIEKPWWQNNWLKLTGILFIALIIYLFYKNRINKIKRSEQQKALQNTKMIELEQTALRSQMNPHFIFNCLTSIQQLIVTGKTDDANEYLVRFARLIRKTLELSARPFIKIADEKDYLTEYLILEELRIPGQFDFRIEIDDKIDINKIEIPNMMLQPIVENAIRHGIKHLENRKGNIIISFKLTDRFICCSVTDNGIGRNELIKDNKNLFSGQKSYGMEIIRKRLELQPGSNEEDFFIEVKDIQNADGSAAGTQVIIQLPFKISQA